MTEMLTAEHDSRMARFAAFAEVQTLIAKMITNADDIYANNRGTEPGLVAFGQKVALRGLSERLAWMAAQ